MQKKIIALAVAGLVSGAAFAQVAPNNVTLYGIIDMGYLYQGDNVVAHGDNYSGIDSGGHDGSRFGFKGNEDLGNGLSVGFETEFDFNTDAPGATNGGTGGLQVVKNHLYLAGANWGKVKAGSFGNSIDDIGGFSESGGMGWGNGVIGLKVYDTNYNAVKYVSPSWGGFGFNVAYSTNNQNTQDTAAANQADSVNRQAYDIGAQYVNGGLKVGIGYEQTDADALSRKTRETVLAAGYNFGQFQIGAGYGRFNGERDGYDATRDVWVLTGGFDITAKDHIALSYSASDSDWDYVGIAGDKNYDADAWGISYTHLLSKRTNIYASAYTADAPEGFIGTDDYNNATVSGFETAIKFGVRHQF